MINSEEHTTIKTDLHKSEHLKSEVQKSEHLKSEHPVVIYNQDNSIIINFNQEDYSFKVFNINKMFLGSFSNKDFIKFITNKVYPGFFLNIGSDSSFPLIKKYICDVVFVDDTYKIKLLNYLESPFMANIEMIIKLYQGIVQLNDVVKIEIEKISDQIIKKQIIKILKQLAYVFLNYSLRLIAQISSTIKNDQTKAQLKDTLLRQSVMIVYKLNTFMRDELEEKTFTYKLLQDDLIKIGQLKLEMYRKINDLDKRVTEQNTQLSELKIKFDQIMLGNNSHKSPESDKSNSDMISLETKSQQSELNNSSYMFNDSDCYYTESGDAQGINYLSPK